MSFRDGGESLSELPGVMSAGVMDDDSGKEDLPRIARTFAFSTDPPAFPMSPPPEGFRRARRPRGIERPFADQGTPVVLAITRRESAIAVPAEAASGSGLLIWRRPVFAHLPIVPLPFPRTDPGQEEAP